MNTPKLPRHALALLSTLALLTSSGRAQAISQPAPAPESKPTTPAPVDVASAESEEPTMLSPFTVETTAETGGYIAKSTLAGSRVRTDLRDVASAISVVTSQFLKDTGSTSNQDLLIYTTNTEVGGIRGNFSGAAGSSTYDETAKLLRPDNNTRVRGLEAADNTRGYFMSEVPWDSYNVDSIGIQRGANSILFGVGSPAGIINTTLNDAQYKNAYKYSIRVDQNGSIRNVLDLNYVVLPKQLALRVEGLDDHTYYEQKPAYNHTKRYYGAVRYDPVLFGKGSHTSIRANIEDGKVDSNNPRDLPPNDQITPWFNTGTFTIPGYGKFNNLNRLTLDPRSTWNQYGNANSPVVYPNGQYPWLLGSMSRQNTGVETIYNAGGGAPTRVHVPTYITGGAIDENGNIKGTIDGIEFFHNWAVSPYSAYAAAVLPGGIYYSDKSLADSSIFDFYKKLIDGNNKKEWQNWRAGNVAVSQTFFNDRLGFEAAYDYQRYHNGQESFLSGAEYRLSIDLNTYLADGTPNPNLGRPYIGNSGQYGNNTDAVYRDGKRVTAFGDLRATDYLEKSWVTKLLGHHVVTGLLSHDTRREDARSFVRWATTPEFASQTIQPSGNNIANGPRQIDWIAYLGPSLLNSSSAANANLSNITGDMSPATYLNTKYFNSTWSPQINSATGVAYKASDPYTFISHDQSGNAVTNTGTQNSNPANYTGWTTKSFQTLSADRGDIASLYTSGTKSRQIIQSQGFTWQGYMWDGTLVPVFGWRKDRTSLANSNAPKDANGVSIMDYSVDTSSPVRIHGESKTWGIVAHTPLAWRSKLPWETNISLFFNHSENFKADAPRGDIAGNQIPNPQGKTKEYGFMVSTFHDRVRVKLDWYETSDKNATLSGAAGAGFGSNLYYAWALPYWGATHALAVLDGLNNYRQGNWGWPWNGITGPDGVTTATTTQLRADVADFFHNFPLSQKTADEYGLGLNVAKMHAAQTDAEYYAAVPAYGLNSAGVYDTVNGLGAGNGLGLQPAYAGKLKSYGDGPKASSDVTSKGVELEVTTQLTKNWSLTLNGSKTEATLTSVSPTIDAWVASFTKFFGTVNNPTPAGLIKLWGGSTFAYNWNAQILSGYNLLKAQVGQSAPELAPYRVNIITNYYFDRGFAKGTNVGLAYRWEDKRILGYQYDATTNALDTSKPWKGPTDQHFDAWVGYSHNLTRKIGWNIQLNLRNVGDKNKLVPVSLEPDGTVGLSRIQYGMGAQLTNTFTF